MKKEQAQQLRKRLLKERKTFSGLAEESLRSGGSLCDPAVLEQATQMEEIIVPLEEDTPLPGAEKIASLRKKKRSSD